MTLCLYFKYYITYSSFILFLFYIFFLYPKIIPRMWVNFLHETDPLAHGEDVAVLPAFRSAWGRWPPRSVWVWTGTCWLWTGSPAPAAAGWWKPFGASGTSPTVRTGGPLEEGRGRASESEKRKESHFQARQLVCYLILVNKSSFKSSWVQFLCLIENAWMCFAERSKINQRSRTVTATAVFFLSSQGRRKCDVILWVGQAHIWPHSAAIINYNSFTPVYCWRGGQGRSGRGGP